MKEMDNMAEEIKNKLRSIKQKKKIYIFGPCSAESREQVWETATALKEKFSDFIFRAGVWKPRTRPNSFEGKGAEAMDWLMEVKRELNLPVATEVANSKHVELSLKAGVDHLWLGARTTVNPFMVQEISEALKGTSQSVWVKNPIHPDAGLWVGAVERLQSAGLSKIGLIHRGFYTYQNLPFRNFPHWEIPVQLMTTYPDYPMVCDISHIAGKPAILPKLAQKAIDLNMNGLLVETHIDPPAALSDAEQQITPAALSELLNKLAEKKEFSENREFLNKLEELRHEIDKIDDDLVDKLAQRMNVAAKIGQYKKQNQVTILQMERWKKILRRVEKSSLSLGMNTAFVRSLYNLIHEESIRIQTNGD
jgi:chorismate mutase